jgi:hypothetical protein
MINYHPETKLLVQHFSTDDAQSDRHCSYHSDYLYRILDEWQTSRTKSSSGTQEIPFDWKRSFNAQHTRMGDVCEVGKRIQSVMRLWSSAHWQYPSNALRRFRYCSRQRSRYIDSCLKLVQSRHRPSRPKIQYLLQQVSRFKYSSSRWNLRRSFLASIRPHFTMFHEL